MIGQWIIIKKYNLKGIQTTYWDPIPSRKLVLNNAIHICWPKIEIDLVNKAYESPMFVYNKEMDTLVSKVFRSMEVEKDNAPHNSWNRWRHHEFQCFEVSFGHNYNMTFFSHSCNVLMIMDIVYFWGLWIMNVVRVLSIPIFQESFCKTMCDVRWKKIFKNQSFLDTFILKITIGSNDLNDNVKYFFIDQWFQEPNVQEILYATWQ
jgi:hypothetical protein